MKRGITKDQFMNYVNTIAGKNITFLNSPRNLAKDYSKKRTIAIESSEKDYQIFSNPEIWDSNLMIKDFNSREEGIGIIKHQLSHPMKENKQYINHGRSE